MTILKTIVVDDEPLALELLCSYLDEMPEVEIIARCKNGTEALEAAATLEPDLVFLDIQMPGMTGFEVAKNLQSDQTPMIIFATAYDQYAVDAFEIHAVDYILKPLEQERIQLSIERAAKRALVDSPAEQSKAKVLNALEEMERREAAASNNVEAAEPVSSKGKIVIKDRDSINLIDQNDIAWIDAAGDYMCVHVEGETHIMRSTMKKLLEQLDEGMFKRVHRSTVVNMKHIKQIFPHTKGEYFLLICEHYRIKGSRNYRDVVKEFLEQV